MVKINYAPFLKENKIDEYWWIHEFMNSMNQDYNTTYIILH